MSSEYRRRVRLDPSLYLPSAVQHAADAFGALLGITRDLRHPDVTVITPLSADVPVCTIDEFLNFSLAASIDVLLRPR